MCIFIFQIGGYSDGSAEVDKSSFEAYDSQGNVLNRVNSQCTLGSYCTCVEGSPPSSAQADSNLKSTQIDENFTKAWGMVMSLLSGLGFISAFIMLVYFAIFYPVRGGTTIIAYVLLLGVILLYLLNFAFIVQADTNICGIRRFSLAFVYAICISCLLVKVIHNWRVDVYSQLYINPKLDPLLHPISLSLILLALILVQAALGVQWVLLDKPQSVIHAESVLGARSPRCSPLDFHYEELLLSCIYPMILLVLTAIFSGVSWNAEENHHESRMISIVAWIIICFWIIMSILICVLDWEYRDPVITVINFLNASFMLSIFVKKMYLLHLYKKEEGGEEGEGEEEQASEGSKGWSTH